MTEILQFDIDISLSEPADDRSAQIEFGEHPEARDQENAEEFDLDVRRSSATTRAKHPGGQERDGIFSITCGNTCEVGATCTCTCGNTCEVGATCTCTCGNTCQIIA